jgi:3-hydroxyacyl-CoA dehydrogenase / enoyl-CoA hydratase / 3-hydroxybutyryl-CoA epimerase
MIAEPSSPDKMSQTSMSQSPISIEHDGPIAVVVLDQPDRPVNTLSTDMLDAIDQAITSLMDDAAVEGIVVISGKESGFIAGADVRELRSLHALRDAEALSQRGHAMIRRVRSQSKPLVAAIHGAALGGGLEFALACDYRIASNDAKLGLPEVKLGLLPGGGGTQLLPRLVGIQEALGMMLTGKNVFPRKARRIGLIDATTHREGLRQAAVSAARELATGAHDRSKTNLSLPNRLMDGNPVTRGFIFKKAREGVLAQTRGNYPAPNFIIECVEEGYRHGIEAGLELESLRFAELVFSDVSRQLVFLFFAQQDASRNPYRELVEPSHSIGILGGGLMGGGIAALSAKNGLSVRIKDIDLDHAASARKVAADYSRDLAKKGALTKFERDVLIERVTPVESYDALKGVDAVIEAVPESLDIKHDVLKSTEAVLEPAAIFASNTSSIPIAQIAAASSRPERVIGMHYFSPVPQVPLLEIVRTKVNSDEVVGRAFEIGLRQGKTIIVVNDGPGFYTTRVLAIYMNEALMLLEEGGRIEEIDRVMKDFGFPMGPFALFDLVGIDVAVKIAEVLDPFFAERGQRSSSLSARLVKAGLKGQKSMRGFYLYEEGKRGHPERKGVNDQVYAHAGGAERRSVQPEEITSRLSLIFVNEAIRCLDDGILDRPQDGDVGAVFGLGFPPFLGGPFRHADRIGAKVLLRRLSDLEAQNGIRFDPAPSVVQMARADIRFYE